MNGTVADKRLPRFISIGVVHLALISSALAQHYVSGIEGIRAGTLPMPGIYFRDYNVFSYDKYNYNDAISQPSQPLTPPYYIQTDVKQTSYLNEPRLIWITNQKVFGANYGMDLIVPFGYVKNEFFTPAQIVFVPLPPPQPGPPAVPIILHPTYFIYSRFGLGDVEFEPLLLSWNLNHFDFSVGYGIWAPTGDFDANAQANVGFGFWSHMITAGATWYPDHARSWAVSLLNHYEINQEQAQTDATYPQMFTLEWGVSKGIFKNLEIGVVGYWSDEMSDFNYGGGTFHSESYAIGPEISMSFPKLGLTTSLRYLRWFDDTSWQNVVNGGGPSHIEGNKVVLTVTERF